MISVIIPVLNDVQGLRRTLHALVAEKEGHEVLVVDGGSIDGSRELAESFPWVTLLQGPARRALRLNEATVAARGDLLLFLNPGTTLERGWPAAVEEAGARPDFSLGCFRLHLDSPRIWYRLFEALAWVRSSILKFPMGSQALFVRKASVVEGRVFLDLPAHEDLELVRRMRRVGRLVQVKASAINPVDRWESSSAPRRVVQDTLIFLGLLRGAHPDKLAQFADGADQALVIFVKRPEPGLVKTWMVDLFGKDRAAMVYRRSVEEILHTARTAPVDARLYVFYTPIEARADMLNWLGDSCMLIPQQGDDDRERRGHALDTLFQLGVERVVLLGPHCPAMQRHHVAGAMRALQTHEAVLGPTDDGGCYLIGIHRKHRDLIVGLQWEPDGVFSELASALSSAGVDYHCLETLKDLDSVEDLPFNWALGLVQD